MSKGTGKRQHFIPQAYLKRFTDTGKKDGTLFVYDLIKDREFQCKPDNVAHRNQFYRLNKDLYHGVDPDAVDRLLDKNVPTLDKLIDEITNTKVIPAEKNGESIFDQIALLIARSPENRTNSIILYEVAAKEHMLSQIESAPEQIKKLVEKVGIYKALNIEFNEDYFKQIIFETAISYYKVLVQRSWQVVEASSNMNFVTSDLPITVRKLTSRRSVGGLAAKDTIVFFRFHLGLDLLVNLTILILISCWIENKPLF